MVDPDKTRADWMNEAHETHNAERDDIDLLMEASELLTALMSIGKSATVTELRTTVAKLRRMIDRTNDDETERSLDEVADAVEAILESQLTAYRTCRLHNTAAAIREDIGPWMARDFNEAKLLERWRELGS